MAFSVVSGVLTLQGESNSKGTFSLPGESGDDHSAFISEVYILMTEKKVVIRILRDTGGVSKPETLFPSGNMLGQKSQ